MNDIQNTYSISDLSSEFDITPRTLRFYEDRSLIQPTRKGQSRIYSSKDRARVIWILRGKRVGFSLTEISDVLNLYYQDSGLKKQRTATIKACDEKIAELELKKHDIDETIEELNALKDSVKELAYKCDQNP
jgi:DNA-binding transcriptional MerR regulator